MPLARLRKPKLILSQLIALAQPVAERVPLNPQLQVSIPALVLLSRRAVVYHSVLVYSSKESAGEPLKIASRQGLIPV